MGSGRGWLVAASCWVPSGLTGEVIIDGDYGTMIVDGTDMTHRRPKVAIASSEQAKEEERSNDGATKTTRTATTTTNPINNSSKDSNHKKY